MYIYVYTHNTDSVFFSFCSFVLHFHTFTDADILHHVVEFSVIYYDVFVLCMYIWTEMFIHNDLYEHVYIRIPVSRCRYLTDYLWNSYIVYTNYLWKA